MDWLPLAEFALNNNTSESTGVSPFYANTGRHPKFLPDTREVTDSELSDPQRVEAADAHSFAQRMTEIQQALRDELALARTLQEEYANQHQRLQSLYKPGDMVYVNTKNFKRLRPSSSLDNRFAGPYKVVKAMGPEPAVTYQVQLPEHIKVNNNFHVSLLKRASVYPLPNQIPQKPPPVEVDDSDTPLWSVEALWSHRKVYQRGRVKKGSQRKSWIEYLVKWEGYEGPTWEPITNLIPNAIDSLHQYHDTHLDAPRPAVLDADVSRQHLIVASIQRTRLTEMDLAHNIEKYAYDDMTLEDAEDPDVLWLLSLYTPQETEVVLARGDVTTSATQVASAMTSDTSSQRAAYQHAALTLSS